MISTVIYNTNITNPAPLFCSWILNFTTCQFDWASWLWRVWLQVFRVWKLKLVRTMTIGYFKIWIGTRQSHIENHHENILSEDIHFLGSLLPFGIHYHDIHLGNGLLLIIRIARNFVQLDFGVEIIFCYTSSLGVGLPIFAFMLKFPKNRVPLTSGILLLVARGKFYRNSWSTIKPGRCWSCFFNLIMNNRMILFCFSPPCRMIWPTHSYYNVVSHNWPSNELSRLLETTRPYFSRLWMWTTRSRKSFPSMKIWRSPQLFHVN